MFYYFILSNLFQNHHKALDHIPEILVRCGAAVCMCAFYITLWITYMIDPGVIPRKKQLDLEKMANLKPGERVCYTCKIIRPPRAKHCRYCDHCVEVFDHHCPYVGVCIGRKGNYPFFALLLIASLIGATYVGTFSGWYFFQKYGICFWTRVEPGCLRENRIVAFLLACIMVSIVLVIGQLGGYHILIAFTGETTNQRVLTRRARKRPTGSEFLALSRKESLLKDPSMSESLVIKDRIDEDVGFNTLQKSDGLSGGFTKDKLVLRNQTAVSTSCTEHSRQTDL